MNAKIKLKKKIKNIVFSEKKTLLQSQLFIKKWLQLFINSAKTSSDLMKKNVNAEYQKFMINGFRDWPAGGPQQWLAKWKNLLIKFEKYGITIINWMTHVFAMWQNVFNFTAYFKFFERKKSWKTLFKIHFIQLNRNIQRKYEQQKHQLVLRYSKTKSS